MNNEETKNTEKKENKNKNTDPINVLVLENMQYCVICGRLVDKEDVLKQRSGCVFCRGKRKRKLSIIEEIDRYEKYLLKIALELNKGVVTHAAKALNCHRPTLIYKLKKYKIEFEGKQQE